MTTEIALLTVIAGLIFDYTNGFHDAANVVATPIATKVLRPLTAILMASIFNFLGATQISGVAQTISSGLVQSQFVSQIMVLSAVIGAIFWNLLTWYFGIPSSSSYALIGGLIGSAFMGGGCQLVLWAALLLKVIIPMVVAPLLGFIFAFIGMKVLKRFVRKDHTAFRFLQIISAAFVALSHGLNDAQKSMGIITLALFTGKIIAHPIIPIWVIGACALIMAFGTATGGFKIIHTMGFKITHLKPIQGFVSEFSASCIILTASFLGMPLSSTHTIVASITGVGAAKHVSAVEWLTIYRMVIAWFLTLPGAGLVSGIIFKFLNIVFY